VEDLKLIVAKDGIYIDEKMVVPLKEGRIADSALDSSDPDFITDLFTELDQQVEVSKQIKEENKEFEFEGKVVMQADAALDYGLLKKVMYTTSMAGFADMKLATMSSD
jgi:biopolymer transport protein ExbD